MQQKSEELEDLIINQLDNYFKDAIDCFTIEEYEKRPWAEICIRTRLYNYIPLRIMVERNEIFFSIIQAENDLTLLKRDLGKFISSGYDLSSIEWECVLKQLEQEVKLRIPDKYLKAKGWL